MTESTDKDTVWIAGPVSYNTRTHFHGGGTIVSMLLWEFIGGTAEPRVKRWALAYRVGKRSFSLHQRRVSEWEQAHAAEVAEFYRPAAVLRSDLPRRSIVAALRAMLSDKERARAAAISIAGGKT